MDANPKRIREDALSEISGYVWTGPKAPFNLFRFHALNFQVSKRFDSYAIHYAILGTVISGKNSVNSCRSKQSGVSGSLSTDHSMSNLVLLCLLL